MLVGTIRTVGVVWRVGVLMTYAFVMVALNGMVMTVGNGHGSDIGIVGVGFVQGMFGVG